MNTLDDDNLFDSDDGDTSFPVYPYPNLPPRNTNKRIYYYIFIPIALIILGAILVVLTKKSDTATQTPTNNPTQHPPASPKNDVPNAPTNKQFENGYLGVKLTYPDNWTAIEPDNRDSVRLESPEFSYQSSAKGRINGNFRIYIRKGARDVDGKYIGRGVAIQPTEKLVYTAPTQGQRTETNLSHFGLDTPDNFAFFLIAGNFQLNKGDTLGPDYGKETETFIIAGGFSSPDLTEDLATNSVAVNVINSSNAYKQAINILKSLQLQ